MAHVAGPRLDRRPPEYCRASPATCASLPGPASCPTSYQTLTQQEGNFPVFEGTSLYSLAPRSQPEQQQPSHAARQCQPEHGHRHRSQRPGPTFWPERLLAHFSQTYRDVAGVVQDTWTLGTSKVNEFRFQYARRGLNYFYNTQIPGGSDPAINIPGFAYFGREPYSYIQRVENRYQFTDNFSWSIGPARHQVRRGLQLSPAASHFHGELWWRVRLGLAHRRRGPPHRDLRCYNALSLQFRILSRAGLRLRRPAETTFRASAVPAISFPINPWACSGRIPGACATMSP